MNFNDKIVTLNVICNYCQNRKQSDSVFIREHIVAPSVRRTYNTAGSTRTLHAQYKYRTALEFEVLSAHNITGNITEYIPVGDTLNLVKLFKGKDG